MATTIHPTAIIDPGTKIGTEVSIGPYAIVGPDVQLGDRTVLGPHTVVEYASLGADCQVFPQATIGLAPQHFKYKGEKTRVEIGNRCTFREGVTVHRGTTLDESVTRIGSDCYFMALSHVAHDCRIGNNVTIANASQLAGHVHIDDFTFISGTVGIHQFVRIGRCVMIGGGSMVSLDVAPFCTVQGDRATIRGLNLVGLKRMKTDRSTIRLIRDAYKTIFSSGLLLEDALLQPELQVDNPMIRLFKDFFMMPKRGFMRPSTGRLSLPEKEELIS